MDSANYTRYPPSELGVDQSKLAGLIARAAQAIDNGPLPSVQIALARHGRLALFTTLGEANNSQRYNIFSCTKPIVASAIWLLMAEGKLQENSPLSALIPELSDKDIGQVTLEQLLTHTAGFPNAPLGPPNWLSRQGRLDKMQSWRLNWQPGSQMEYHPSSAHWVLAEIIERLSGMDYRTYIERAILSPLGLHKLQLGVPSDQQSNITTLLSVGSSPSTEELKKLFGVTIEWPDISDTALLRFNEPETRALGVPGGGAIANAASVALFYQCLLHNPKQLWDPEILADATGSIRCKFMDPATRASANRSLGLVIAGDDGMAGHRGMGKTVSTNTFGHPGAGGQVAWADPVSGISFCLLTNGLDANPIRAARFSTAMSNRAGSCLLNP